MSEWSATTWIVVVIGCAIALYAFHRLALYLEREGWIRYLKNPPQSDGGAAMLGELQKIYEPQTRHVYELKEQKRPRREADAGEDPS
jgi:hypothetical protein